MEKTNINRFDGIQYTTMVHIVATIDHMKLTIAPKFNMVLFKTLETACAAAKYGFPAEFTAVPAHSIKSKDVIKINI